MLPPAPCFSFTQSSHSLPASSLACDHCSLAPLAAVAALVAPLWLKMELILDSPATRALPPLFVAWGMLFAHWGFSTKGLSVWWKTEVWVDNRDIFFLWTASLRTELLEMETLGKQGLNVFIRKLSSAWPLAPRQVWGCCQFRSPLLLCHNTWKKAGAS